MCKTLVWFVADSEHVWEEAHGTDGAEKYRWKTCRIASSKCAKSFLCGILTILEEFKVSGWVVFGRERLNFVVIISEEEEQRLGPIIETRSIVRYMFMWRKEYFGSEVASSFNRKWQTWRLYMRHGRQCKL